MGLLQQYEHACSQVGIQPSESIREAIQHVQQRRLSLRHEGSLQPQLPSLTVDDSHLQAICLALKDDATISVLDLRFNRITDAGCQFLKELLEVNRSLLELQLDNNDFEQAGAYLLGEALQINQTLKRLSLKGNKIGDKGNLSIASALQINTTLLRLNVGETDMEQGSLIAYVTVLSEQSSLQELDISRPIKLSRQEETLSHLGAMLQRNTSLTKLVLQKNGITDTGLEQLVRGLLRNTTLKHLDLSRNRIAYDGAVLLADVISAGTALCSLDLGFNRVGAKGAAVLAAALKQSTITHLSMQHNEVDARGCELMFGGVPEKLEVLTVWGNPGVTGGVAASTTQALQDLMMSRQHSVPGLSLDVALFQTADGEERIAEAELPPIVVV